MSVWNRLFIQTQEVRKVFRAERFEGKGSGNRKEDGRSCSKGRA